MTHAFDPLSTGALRPEAAQPAPGSKPNDAGSSPESGAAFRAIFERLEERARELEQKSQSLEDASGLAGAVDTARASLEDAVSLSDQLLEAYREARTQGGAGDPAPSQGTTENRT